VIKIKTINTCSSAEGFFQLFFLIHIFDHGFWLTKIIVVNGHSGRSTSSSIYQMVNCYVMMQLTM